MKLSELLHEMSDVLIKHGDIDVILASDAEGNHMRVLDDTGVTMAHIIERTPDDIPQDVETYSRGEFIFEVAENDRPNFRKAMVLWPE